MTEAAQKSRAPATASHGRSRQAARAQGTNPGFGAATFGALQGMAGNAAVSNALGGGRPKPPQQKK